MVIIEEVEAVGGMTKAIESGMAKLRIEESATRKQARIDAAEDVVVGVNKYRIPAGQAEAVDVLRIDNSSVLQSQVEGIRRVKAGRDEALVQAALAKLSEAAATQTTNKVGMLRMCMCMRRIVWCCEPLTCVLLYMLGLNQ
jgi:methylmalonyl-CoA mutase